MKRFEIELWTGRYWTVVSTARWRWWAKLKALYYTLFIMTLSDNYYRGEARYVEVDDDNPSALWPVRVEWQDDDVPVIREYRSLVKAYTFALKVKGRRIATRRSSTAVCLEPDCSCGGPTTLQHD